ncbi:MAG TPA: WYL domain-containing protein [Mycobacteriales bacterium]|nr:WYL domain-containing protein [Mycobacteriales bacterium]
MTGGGLTERLPRLLTLVPYLLARPGVPLADVAADFGIGERQLRRDLELLWMCGLPGYGPGDLVDLSFAGDTVTVTEDAGLRRPLRLTTAEGTALLVALRTLGDLPGMVDTDAVRRATAKIERAVGDAGAAGVAVEVSRQEQATTTAVREALEAGRALTIRYYTAGRDAVTRRTVDPMRLLLVEGRGYLEAWCRRAGAVRLFRLDRVDEVVVLDEPAAAPPDAEPTDLSAGVFPARPEHGSAVLLLEPWARWVAEYYPVEQVVELPPDPADERNGHDHAPDGRPGRPADGRARVLMRYADPAWLVRLVLGLGGGARILEPPELAAEVARRASEALALARTNGGTDDGTRGVGPG